MLMEKIYAQASGVVGNITNPLLPEVYKTPFGENVGIILLFSNILSLVFVAAGIYALVNLIVAGFMYMQAGGDSKILAAAWARIWQSLLGLVIIVGSFALATLFSYIIFGDPSFILKPRIYGPGIQ